MRDKPTGMLNPKIKIIWRISDTIVLSIVALILLIPGLVVFFSASDSFYPGMYCAICLILYVIALFAFWLIVIPIRYIRFHYEISPDYLDIECGVIWRKRCIVPFIRVQNTDTFQGPISRSLGLSSVSVSTAAGSVVIPGLISEEADEVRDRAAEYARLAREDV